MYPHRSRFGFGFGAPTDEPPELAMPDQNVRDRLEKVERELAEHIAITREFRERMDERLNNTSGQIGRLEAKIDTLTSNLQSKIDSVNEKIQALTTSMRVLETRIGTHAAVGALIGGGVAALVVSIIQSIVLRALGAK